MSLYKIPYSQDSGKCWIRSVVWKFIVYHTYLMQKIVFHFLFDLQLSGSLSPFLLMYLLSNISHVPCAHFAMYQKHLVLRELFYVIFFVCHLPFSLIILAMIFIFAVVKFS